MVTQERLHEMLSYEPDTGIFRWKKFRGGAVAGAVAGTQCHNYISIRIDHRIYRAHRLAWLYVHGTHPIGEIDHINGVTTDNRIANLRDVSRFENSWNQFKAQSNNATGFRGVHIRKMPSGSISYRAKINANGKGIVLGHFKTAEEASEAYLEAKKELHRVKGSGI